MAPTVNTVATSYTSASAQQEIKDIEAGLDKLDDKKLKEQRYTMSGDKMESMGMLALAAKLERALDRRLGGQDAVMRKKVVKKIPEQSEKVAVV